jgi:hypothetical protein
MPTIGRPTRDTQRVDSMPCVNTEAQKLIDPKGKENSTNVIEKDVVEAFAEVCAHHFRHHSVASPQPVF